VWLKIGIPVLVLLGLITVRIIYYIVWRRHWDRRPPAQGKPANTEVIVISTSRTPPHVKDNHR
jgi:hypothetical protein